MKDILDLHKKFNLEYNNKNTILVAGTNGKGSTCEYLEKVFMYKGYKVGKFTSPHIYTKFERIQINGKNISEDDFSRLENFFNEYSIGLFAKYFLMAEKYFKEEKVDIKIIEVGIGGLLDTTNILNAKYSIITSISFDHMNILGNTLEEIAYQKAGIAKNNKICVYNDKILDKSLDTFTNKKVYVDREYSLDISNKLGIYSKEQIHNLSNCIKIFEMYNISNEEVLEGLKNIRIKFRHEKISVYKNNVKYDVIVDVCHNEDSFNKLIDFLNENYKNKEYIFLLSVLETKDISTIYNKIKAISNEIYFYEMPNEHNGRSKENILSNIDIDKENVLSLNTTLNEELNKYFIDDKKIYILCGSFYFVSKFVV